MNIELIINQVFTAVRRSHISSWTFPGKPVFKLRQSPGSLLAFILSIALAQNTCAAAYATTTERKADLPPRLSNAEKCYNMALESGFSQDELIKQQYKRALYFCNKALRFDSLSATNKARTYINRGVLLKNMAQLKRASGDFRRANLLIGRSADIQVNLGNLAYLRGDFDRALKQYDRALAWNLSKPYKAHLNRGLTYERLGDMDAARNSYQQALLNNPQLDIAREQLNFIGSAKPVAVMGSNRVSNVYRTGS